MNRHVRSLLIPALSLFITSCLGGNSDEPAATDSQTGNLPPPIYGTSPSPIDTESNILGPWFFKSTNFELTRTTTDFTIGNLQPGRYKLKIQNGNYGPFLARTCAAITDTAQKRQCLYDNLIEKTTQEFTRTEKSLGSLNGVKLFNGKTLTRTFAYKEESIQLQATNQFLIDVQAFPTASLKMNIDYAEEFATPVALFSVNSLSGTAPATIKFNAVHSYDADNADTLTYEWNFGDGQTATGLTANHVYSAAGTYTARLKVTDQTGRFDEFTAEIFIKAAGTPPPATNKNPVLKLSVTYPDPENLRKINVSLANSYDTDGLIMSHSIDWGDQTPKVTASEAEHTYAKDGTYLLKVSVTDDLGGKASLTESLSISTTNDLIAAAKIYGTKTYYGDIIGERRITDTFQIPLQDLNAIYKLTIKNADGLPHDQKSCSGLTGASLLSCQYDNLVNKTYIATQRLDYVHAYLNGKQITDSTAINKSNYVFSTIIAPQETNTLEIRMKGFPTAYAQIYIEKMQVADNTPPILSLRSPRPEENYYSNQSPTNIQVVVDSNKVLTSGTINGVAARVLDGNILVANVPFASAGRNQISVQATDLEGNAGSANFGFDLIRDQVAPDIQLSFVDNGVVNNPIVYIPIIITDASPTVTSISVNGEELFKTTSKNYTTPITLPFQGENIVSVQSIDAAGNASGSKSVRIYRDTAPPVIAFNIANGAVFREMTFNVSGSSNEPMSYLKMNGNLIELNGEKNNFSEIFVGERLGYHTFNFEYADNHGNVGTSTIQVRLIGKLVNQALISVRPSESGEKYLIIGGVSSVRPSTQVRAFTNLFGTNRDSTTADTQGVFGLQLSSFSQATVSVFDPEFNEKEEFVISSNMNTTLSGVIKDIYDNPLPNATVSISGSSQSILTDGNGVFVIQNPPTGDQALVIDGSTIPDPTEGVVRSYSITKLAVSVGVGQNNNLIDPIYLTPLLFDGTETDIENGSGASVTSPHAPDVRIDIPSNVVTFPDGTNSGSINMMTIPSARTTTRVIPSFVPTNVVSFEPSGVTFSERVPISLPNDNELPAGTEMLIFSMNSGSGLWEVDGLAKVSEDGSKVESKPGMGISHFSIVYTVPLAPVIAAVKNPNLAGIDVTKGGANTSISLPSFKIFGQGVSPGLVYKSTWANPTALVSNIFDIPRQKVSGVTNSYGNYNSRMDINHEICFVVCFKFKIGDYYVNSEVYTHTDFTNMYVPDRVRSQFFVSRTATDAVEISNTAVDEQIEQIQGTPIANAEASRIIEQVGIPSQAIISYAVELVDSRTGNYLQSGIYPTLARYEIRLKNLTISTNTYDITTTSRLVMFGFYERRNTDYTRRVVNHIQSNLFDLIPRDLTENILVQNKVQSPAGRGWHIAGAQKIINPENSKIMIEEASGDVSTYAINNVMTTLYDGANTSVDLQNGVDLSYWPRAIANNHTTSGAFLSEIDLSVENPSPTNLAQTPTSSGVVVDQNYNTCAKEYRCQYGVWCFDHFVGTFSTKSYNYTMKPQLGGILRSAGGEVFVTNNAEHAFYKTNGNFTKLYGTTSPVDDYIFTVNQGQSYFLSTKKKYNDECQKYFGSNCTIGQTVATGQNCEAANDIVQAQWECLSHDRWGSCNWWNWNYYGTVPGQKMFSQSSGTMGIASADGSGLNNPTYMAGSPSGKIYISDTGNNRVVSYDPATGIVATVAGNGQNYETVENVPALETSLYHPKGLALDDEGNLYIAIEAGFIKKVDTNGIITNFAGKPLYSGGLVSDEASARELYISSPEGLFFDSTHQHLYVADGAGNKIYRINFINGIASNVAGTGQCVQGDIGDNAPATFASICKPTQVGIDLNHNLIFVDTGHNRIRRVNFTSPADGVLAYAPSNRDLSRLLKNSNGSWTRQYRSGDYDSFDSSGNQIRSTDRLGRFTEFTYGANQNLAKVKFPDNQELNYYYTSGKLSQIVDPAGRSTIFSYSGDHLFKVIFPDGSSRKFYYDIKGQLTSEINQRNFETRYEYNAWNRVEKVIKPDNAMVQINEVSAQTVTNPPEGSGEVTAMKSPGFGDGQVANNITNEKGEVTSMRQNAMGYISQIKGENNKNTSIERDFDGKPLKVTKADGTVTTMTYDRITRDLLTTKDEVTGTIESREYNQFGQVIRETNAKGQTILSEFDPNTGLLKKVTYPLQNYEEFIYYQSGSLKGLLMEKRTSNGGQIIKSNFEYNAKGQLTREIDNAGKWTEYQYDLAGNISQVISTTNGTDRIITQSVFDDMNRLTRVIHPKTDEVTEYRYLLTGQLEKIIDPNDNETFFEYDSLGQLIKKTEAIGASYQYFYDEVGNKTKEIDPNGNIKLFSYNAKNQIMNVQFPDDLVQYEYSDNGDAIRSMNLVSKVEYAIDSKNRIRGVLLTGLGSMSDFPAVNLEYDYDEANNKVAMRSQHGSIGYFFDENNRMYRLENSWGDYFDREFDPAGRLTKVTRPGSFSTFTYKTNSAIDQITHKSGATTRDYSRYTYDERDFITEKRTPAGITSYAFDINGQLASTSAPNQAQEIFAFDKLGNRTSDENRQYGYDSKGQRLLDDGIYLYSYDQNGNILTKLPKNINSNIEGYRFTYSSKNQMIKAEVFDGTLGPIKKEINYVYDILGRRMQKSVQDFANPSDTSKTYTRRFVYDNENILFEFDQENNLLARHTHNPAGLDAILSTNITSSGVTQKLAQYEGTFYYMKDSQGTVTSLLDPSGGVVQKYNYRSYGKLINIKSGSGQDISQNPVLRSSFTYIGREYEDETGLFYMRARYYDPSTGRFMQKDPIPGDIRVPQTVINQFIYAGNNPVMFTDPSGAFIAALIGLIYEAIAAAISAIYTYIANLMSAIMTADWKGIYDGITGFAGLKDQALGAGKESFVGAFKNYLGMPDLRFSYEGFDARPWDLSFAKGIRSVELSENIYKINGQINNAFRDIAGRNGVVTSTFDGLHGANGTSLHYTGNAIDLRSRDLNATQIKKIINRLRFELGSDYDVVDETNKKSPHFHIEFDPKQ